MNSPTQKIDRRTKAGGKAYVNSLQLATLSIAERFWMNVDKETAYGPKGDCWRWTGDISGGYGRIAIRAKVYRAHRLSFELFYGHEPAKHLFVIHSCDTPDCVNPQHLSEGTCSDNNQDCKKKRRLRYGVAHQNSKLTEHSVVEIRNLAKSGVSQRQIAKRFAVHQSTIKLILQGRTWTHVTGEVDATTSVR